eukprot:1031107-Amphidinium_carterae.2
MNIDASFGSCTLKPHHLAFGSGESASKAIKWQHVFLAKLGQYPSVARKRMVILQRVTMER